jgi:SAM-dependent methyltransferase
VAAIHEKCVACGYVGAEQFLVATDRFEGRTVTYTLVRCPQCTLVWQHDPPKPEAMSEHYTADYDAAIAQAGESSPGRWEARRRVLAQHKTGGALLDLGCSSGSFLETLNPKDWELHGIEMSKESAERAKRRSGAQVFVGDILDAPFPAESFDAITCFHVFEHLYAPTDTLAKVAYWLKPGGIFYVLVPNINSAAVRVFGTYWYGLELPRHLFHYSPASLTYLAEASGLQVAHIETHREVFVEKSSKYIFDDMFRKLGAERAPLSKAKPASLSFKVMRKAFRLTALPVIDSLIGLAGDGESIHAVLRK